MHAKKSTQLYLSDFVTGLLVALPELDVTRIDQRDERLSYAAVRVFNDDLPALAEQAGVEILFRIMIREGLGSSPSFLGQIRAAGSRNLCHWRVPPDGYLYLSVKPEQCQAFLENLPGDPALYRALAERLESYLEELNYSAIG